MVRENQEEYFSRYGLLLDTFCPRAYSSVFEGAVSVAASILMASTSGSILDLMFVWLKPIIAAGGQGLAEHHEALEVLASVTTCQDQFFTALSPLLSHHLNGLSALVIVLLDLEEERISLLADLAEQGLDCRLLLASVALVFLNYRREEFLIILGGWLPLILLSLIIAQLYSASDNIVIGTRFFGGG